jgi:hypothetical protein
MAASRSKKGLLSSRRRAHDEGEEEEGPEDVLSETQSEGSVVSDVEDLDISDLSDIEEGEEGHSTKHVAAGTAKQSRSEAAKYTGNATQDPVKPGDPAASSAFKTTSDTEAMMNGLKLEDGVHEEGISFEDSRDSEQAALKEPAMTVTPQDHKHETMAERRAREHEDYKQKREADPAFVPTRGGFFMHDQRNSNFGNNMQAGFGRGRGRGGAMNILGAGR